MSSSKSITTQQMFDLLASGTLNGNPAPLKDPVGYTVDNPGIVTMTPLASDPNSVTVKPVAQGQCVITGTSGSLPPDTCVVTVTAPVQEFADTLVLTPQNAVPLA